LLFLDVDGPLNPYANKAERRPEGHTKLGVARQPGLFAFRLDGVRWKTEAIVAYTGAAPSPGAGGHARAVSRLGASSALSGSRKTRSTAARVRASMSAWKKAAARVRNPAQVATFSSAWISPQARREWSSRAEWR
jgi:hypothetical protein